MVDSRKLFESIVARAAAGSPSTGASTDAGVSVSTQAINPAFSPVAGGSLKSKLLSSFAAAAFSPKKTNNPLPAPTAAVNLDLSHVADNNLNPLDGKGFTAQRPSIIASFEFQPAFDDTMSLGNDPTRSEMMGVVGELLDLQASARQLRAEDAVRLINALSSNPLTAPTISNLEARLDQTELDVDKELTFLQQLVQKLSLAKLSFSIKFNGRRIRDDIISRDANTNLVEDPLRFLFVNDLKFSERGYQAFSDTKMLLQMLEDLRVIIKSFSYGALDDIDPRRSTDTDAYTINRSNSLIADFPNSFNISTLSSVSSTALNDVLSQDALAKFTNSINVISDPDVKLGIIFTILSKELRVSAGLGIPTVNSFILNSFNLTDDDISRDVFDKIIGVPGQTIFDAPGGQTSIASLLRVVSGETIVLPFESSVTTRSSETFIPGQSFYVDSIIKGRTKFNTVPLAAYSTAFSTTVNALATVVDGTLDVNVVNDVSLGLGAPDIFDGFLRTMKAAVDNIVQSRDHDAFTPALLNAAADDVTLKHMIVLYVMLSGINISQQPGAKQDFFSSFVSAADLNAGTGISKTVDPRAGLSKAINAIHTRDQSVANEIDLQKAGGSLQAVTVGLLGDILSAPAVGAAKQTGTSLSLVDNSIDSIAAKIIQRVIDIQGSRRPTGPDSIETLTSEGIFNRLATFGDNDSTFLIRGIIDTLDTLDGLARNATNDGLVDYYSNVERGLTRFNRIGAHTLVWLVVETFTSFFKMFPVMTFAGITAPATVSGVIFGTQQLFVRRNDTLLNDLSSGLQQVVTPSNIIPVRPGSALGFSAIEDQVVSPQEIPTRLSAIRSKFNAEDRVIKDIVNVLLGVADSLKSSSSDVVRFFDPSGPNAKNLADVLSTPDAPTKLSALDLAQVTLARNTILEHRVARQQASSDLSPTNVDARLTTTVSPFIDDTVIPPGVRGALYSMLKMPKFMSPAADNLRLLSIGLPAGFMDSLQRRLSTFIVGSDLNDFKKQLQVQNDVIRINVYMRDLLFEDVVFKPLSFDFEVGRFVNGIDFSSVTRNDTRDFMRMVSEAIPTRVLSVDGTTFVSEVGPATAADPSYDAVFAGSDRASRTLSMALNHIQSYLLHVYVKLLTGVDLSEESYFLDDSVGDVSVDDDTDAEFRTLIEQHVTGLAGRRVTLDELRGTNQNVASLLARLGSDTITSGSIDGLGKVLKDANDAVNVEVASDLLTFMKVFTPSAILFGAGARRSQVTSPKLFERIFNVPIDPDDFVIDYDATVSTVSGRSFLDSAVISSLVEVITDAKTTDVSRVSLNSLVPIKISTTARKQLGNLSLQKFFCTIEQLPEIQALQTADISSIVRAGQARPRIADAPLVESQSTIASLQPAVAVATPRVLADIGNAGAQSGRDGLGWEPIL